MAFTGRVPFEVRDVHARPDGFELVFTLPVDQAAAGAAASYEVKQFGYKFHAIYGSPEIDHDGKENSASPVSVAGAVVSADGLRVKLKLSGWRAGYVTSVRSSATSAKGGRKLWHDTFYYTLNRIPK